jgi:hypothetical protein
MRSRTLGWGNDAVCVGRLVARTVWLLFAPPSSMVASQLNACL